MDMTPEKMADFIASELIEELDRLGDWLVAFEDRFSKYAAQFQHLLGSERRSELEDAWKRFDVKTKHLSEGD
jgi:hypothetical protein